MTFTKIFRKDINGLRTVAVLLVLLFHIDSSWLGAGFLGVDVFLVISGYLITKSILFDLDEKRFSLKGFYTRRIRRLFPALAFTIFLVLLLGVFLLSSHFYNRVAQSSLAALFSVSNIFFWLEDGYFNQGSELKPLLHTWSLGLEEQFYLLWPVLLILCYKIRKNLFWFSLFFIGLLSLLAAQYYTPIDSTATFYLLPFRIFEFVLGALCLPLEKIFPSNKRLNIMSHLAGLFLIIVPSILWDKYTDMPGLMSLIPCAGAMLILCASSSLASKALLENKLMSLVGKASYSIYLFHWPLIVFYNHWKFEELQYLDKGILFVSSLVGGIFMWRFVERILMIEEVSSKKVWLSFGGGLLFLSLISGAILIKDGFPSRDKNPYTMTPEEVIAERNRYWNESGAKKFPSLDTTNRNVIIIGNSHGIDLVYALTNNGIKSNIVFLPTTDRCSNFGKTANAQNKKEIDHCLQVNEKNLKREEWSQADVIYLHDNWLIFDTPALKEQLESIRRLTNAPIYIFGPKMIYLQFPLEIIRESGSVVPDEINQFASKYLNPRCEQMNKAVSQWLQQPGFLNANINYIDLLEIQREYELVSSKTSKLLYHDGGHLSENGATELGEKMKMKYRILFE